MRCCAVVSCNVQWGLVICSRDYYIGYHVFHGSWARLWYSTGNTGCRRGLVSPCSVHWVIGQVSGVLPATQAIVEHTALLVTFYHAGMSDSDIQPILWVSEYCRISSLLRLPRSDFKLQASHTVFLLVSKEPFTCCYNSWYTHVNHMTMTTSDLIQ